MGYFTWKAAKGTKKQVAALRRDQAKQAQQANAQQAHAKAQQAQARQTDLFQKLPPEGKEEFRTLLAAFDAKYGPNQKLRGRKVVLQYRADRSALAEGKQEIFRKYDLIP